MASTQYSRDWYEQYSQGWCDDPVMDDDPGSVTTSTSTFLGTALPYPWEAPPYSSKPAPPPPKKPAPEPMDLTSKRRIALNE